MTQFFEYRGECSGCDRSLHTRVSKGRSETNPGETQWCRCGECDEIRLVDRKTANRTLSSEAAP